MVNNHTPGTPNRLTDVLKAPWTVGADTVVRDSAGEFPPLNATAMVAAVNAATADERGETPFVIWSNEHRGWWGPDRRGYVSDLEKAGCYSMEVAMMICYEARPHESADGAQ